MNPTAVSAAPQALELMAQPQAIHAALEGMVTIDQEMHIIMINPAAQRMFGRSARDAIGRPLADLLPQRYRAAHQVHVQRFFDSDQIERPMGQATQLVGLRANGEEFPLEAAICKVELATEDGLQHCCTALLYDRSKEQILTQEIGALNRQMRVVFEHAPIAIWITDGEQIVFANKACGSLFGMDHENDLIGQRFPDLLTMAPQDSGFEWSRYKPGSKNEAATVNAIVARPDGSHREVEISLTPLPDHGERFVQMLIFDTTQRAREKRSLLRSRRTLRELSASIVDAREEERKRIARELHDELGQRLSALKLELSAMAHPRSSGKNAGEEPDRVRHMIDMVSETVAATRRIAMGLRPPMLDDLGLEAAIEWLINDFKDHNPIQVDLRLELLQEPVLPSVSIALYRILQEALTNITRHAEAQQVQIELTVRGQWVQLVVEDDGQGFPEQGPAPKYGSFGLIGMRERVRMLGGQLQVSNGVQSGASLVVRLPLQDNGEAQSRQFSEDRAPPPDTSPSSLTPWELP